MDDLHRLGIRLKSYQAGNHYTTCPRCSPTRKPAHRRLKCLSVKIDAAGFVAHCLHCGYLESKNASPSQHPDRQRPGAKKNQPGNRDHYGDLQRKVLSRWCGPGRQR